MKINHDCIRKILFLIEETTSFNNTFDYDIYNPLPELSNYTTDEIQYHIRQMEWSGLCTGLLWHSDGCVITDLTPEGHKLISEIRSDTNWNKVKQTATKAGVWTLDGIKIIATQVAATAISQALNQHP